MKTIIQILTSLLISFSLFGQKPTNLYEAEPKLTASEDNQTLTPPKFAPKSQSSSIWSEDFSGGIPAGWVNQGYTVNAATGTLTPNAACVWEYRGPSTSPNISTGSRGAYSGTFGPINSATASNGFIIFDSDYLDNNGNSNTMGQGLAPAPHIGTLTTSTIDLSGHSSVELVLNSYAREFFANFLVAVSNDNGSTFPDTVEFHSGLAVNGSTSNAEYVYGNISAVAGGQSQVKLRFIFDGRPGNVNGNGYYFWMIDDIEIKTREPHRMEFVAQPKGFLIDMATNGDFSAPAYGHILGSEAQPVQFNTSLTNTGTSTQYNVRFNVDVYDGSNNFVQTASSPPVSQLAPNNTLNPSQLITGNINLYAVGRYQLVFYATSDSIGKQDNNFFRNPDTLIYTVSDSLMSMDFDRIDNYVGTNSTGSGTLTAMGIKVHLKNAQSLKGIYTALSAQTDPTATLIFEIYDTASFSFSSGFSGPDIASVVKQLSAADVSAGGTYATFANPVNLPAGGYIVHMSMFPSQASGVVRVPNDQTIGQGSNSLIEVDASSWFNGFTSRTYESPHIRAVFDGGIDVSFNITDVSCKGDSNGAATVTVVDPPGTYTYFWNNASTSNSISNVPAGNYTVTITQASTMKSYNYTIIIDEPDSVAGNAVVKDETCSSGNNGSIELFPTGVAPFSYQWNTSDTTSSITGLSGGNYSVTITDADGCTATENYTVNAGTGTVGTPVLNYTDSVGLCSGSNISLNLSNTYSSYQWSNGMTSPSLSVDTAGEYYVKVANGNCEAWSDTIVVSMVEPYEDLEICMVTFDLNQMRNKAIFTNPNMPGIDSVQLFQKESGTGAFSLVGSVSGSTNTEVYDSLSQDWGIAAQEYSLGIMDTCGNESGKSDTHTSMGLTVNKDGNGYAYLAWTAYVGLTVEKYRIYKTTDQFNTLNLLDSVSPSVLSYIDISATAKDSGHHFVVEAVFANAPDCTNGNFAGSITAASYNAISLSESGINRFKMYPNPATEHIRIYNPENRNFSYQLLDLAGKVVKEGSLQPDENLIDLSRFSKGTYLIQISGVPGTQKISIL